MKKLLRILMVEDVVPDAELVRRELRRARLRCRFQRVDSRAAFLRELEARTPDVILSDHGVPGFDGESALAEARIRCPEAPFIFVTGAPEYQAAEKAEASGADDYVLKKGLQRLAPAIRAALRDAAKRERRRQREIRARLARLEAENREQEEFTYVMAMDLRAALRHVESFTELLNKSAVDQLDQKARGHLKTISKSTHEVSRLVDDLFTYARIGRMELRRLPLSVSDLVNEVVHDLRHETEDRQVEWLIGELPEVSADPVLLLMAITQLIANALKFTRPRRQARIEIGSATDAAGTVFFVRDNGVGFDNRSAGRLFEIFQRLHGGEFEGRGVGLANVRRIIHRHRGRIWAESEEGKGATFYFSLPRE